MLGLSVLQGYELSLFGCAEGLRGLLTGHWTSVSSFVRYHRRFEVIFGCLYGLGPTVNRTFLSLRISPVLASLILSPDWCVSGSHRIFTALHNPVIHCCPDMLPIGLLCLIDAGLLICGGPKRLLMSRSNSIIAFLEPTDMVLDDLNFHLLGIATTIINRFQAYRTHLRLWFAFP